MREIRNVITKTPQSALSDQFVLCSSIVYSSTFLILFFSSSIFLRSCILIATTIHLQAVHNVFSFVLPKRRIFIHYRATGPRSRPIRAHLLGQMSRMYWTSRDPVTSHFIEYNILPLSSTCMLLGNFGQAVLLCVLLGHLFIACFVDVKK